MTEWEKAQLGLLYDANYDESLITKRLQTADLCFEFNHCRPSETVRRQEILRKLLGSFHLDTVINAPFYCDYGNNIYVGKNFYANFNCIILDAAPVTFGDNVFIAPNCIFSTSLHPIDAERRNQGLEIAHPITIGSDVWFGANVVVLPNMKIGNNTVIGAGSVVTKDIPSGVVAVGNPCKVLRKISIEDKKKYQAHC